MRLRTFHGATLAEAMRQVRDQLGEQAIIVGTRDDEAGGVRVTAALDEAARASAPRHEPAPAAPPRDLSDLVSNVLYQHGTPPALTERIMTKVNQFNTDDPLLALGAAFDVLLRFQPLPEKPARPLVLVGPPGAGKTLTAAKLAFRHVQQGQRPVVITADVSRAGGLEQLQALTRVMQLALLEVEDGPTLQEALRLHRDAPAVIVDTGGCNPLVDEGMQELRTLLQGLEADLIAVMPAGLDAVDAALLATGLRRLGAAQLILTRLDMTRRLGSALAAAEAAELRLTALSRSGSPTEALQPVNPVVLARLLLPTETQTTVRRA